MIRWSRFPFFFLKKIYISIWSFTKSIYCAIYIPYKITVYTHSFIYIKYAMAHVVPLCSWNKILNVTLTWHRVLIPFVSQSWRVFLGHQNGIREGRTKKRGRGRQGTRKWTGPHHIIFPDSLNYPFLLHGFQVLVIWEES